MEKDQPPQTYCFKRLTKLQLAYSTLLSNLNSASCKALKSNQPPAPRQYKIQKNWFISNSLQALRLQRPILQVFLKNCTLSKLLFQNFKSRKAQTNKKRFNLVSQRDNLECFREQRHKNIPKFKQDSGKSIYSCRDCNSQQQSTKNMQNYFSYLLSGTATDSFLNGGSWSFQENLSYAIFIDIHKKSMTSKKKMREMQFYEKLSLFIGTRSSPQCRSHHQKLFAKFKYISKITQIFKTQLGINNYKIRFGEGLDKMKHINQLATKPQPALTPENDPQPERAVENVENYPGMGIMNFSSDYSAGNGLMMSYAIGPMDLMGGMGWMNLGCGVPPLILGSYQL